MENKEIARLLAETADLMEIAGEDSFRIRSYRNGATGVEGYPERIADILRDPARNVTEIPGARRAGADHRRPGRGGLWGPGGALHRREGRAEAGQHGGGAIERCGPCEAGVDV